MGRSTYQISCGWSSSSATRRIHSRETIVNMSTWKTTNNKIVPNRFKPIFIIRYLFIPDIGLTTLFEFKSARNSQKRKFCAVLCLFNSKLGTAWRILTLATSDCQSPLAICPALLSSSITCSASTRTSTINFFQLLADSDKGSSCAPSRIRQAHHNNLVY